MLTESHQQAVWIRLPGEAAMYRTWLAGWDESGYALLGFPGPKGHDRTMTYPEVATCGGWVGPLPEMKIDHCLHTVYGPDPQDCGKTVAAIFGGNPLCTEHAAFYEWAERNQ